jgi:ABC-type multidrug transport system ATPase subunit
MTNGVVGLLGPNGAGKTTLMQMIATVTRPTSGHITFNGIDVAKNPDAIRRRLGYLPQDFGVYENLTAVEFLGYFAALKGVHDRKRIDAMLEMVNLHTVAKRTIGGFSGGMKQRLGIAQALINDPEIVIVDEPTAGLDPEERVRFRNVLADLGIGKLVILSTHIVSDVESIATHIAIMRSGGIVAYAAPEDLLRSAGGNVWEMVVRSDEFDELRRTAKVSGAVRKSDGVHVRLVSRETAPRRHRRRADARRRVPLRHERRTGRGVTEAVQRVAAIVRADFLIRFRRLSTLVIFLLLSFFAYFWIPDPATGRTLMQIGKARVLYNSAAIGMATATLATIFIGLVGFYVTSNAVQRDLNSRCGFVIASTTMKTREYIAGKFAGNLVFLATFVFGFMLVSMAMVLVRGEAPLQPLLFAKQYAILIPSSIVFVAALSIVFESIPFLSGRFGDVVYFFLWVSSLGVVATTLARGGGGVLRYVDFSGFGYFFEETLRTYHTDNMSIGQSPFDKSVPPRVIDGLHLTGGEWLSRISSTFTPLLLLGIALLFFHRFDPARVRAHTARNGKWMQRLNAIAKPFTYPLTMLTRSGGAVLADARVSIASVPLAAIAFIGITIATFAGGHDVLLIGFAPAAVFIADIASRERRAGTTALVYAAPRLRERFVFWKLGSSVVVATLILAAPVVHTALTRPASLVALLVGIAFVCAAATSLGIISSNPKTFVVLFLIYWYIVVNDKGQTAYFDFAGFYKTPPAWVTLIYAALACALVAAAEGVHRVRLRE